MLSRLAQFIIFSVQPGAGSAEILPLCLKRFFMDTDRLLELLFFTLPAVVTGSVAYYFFKMFVDQEESRRRFQLRRSGRKTALPLRLQAYERMTLFLERIDPAKLMVRVAPVSDDKKDYENYLISQIEQEYEHNLTMQIYVTDECWGIITTAKNATIQLIRKSNLDEAVTSASSLRETILKEQFDRPSPSSAALAFLRDEVKSLI